MVGVLAQMEQLAPHKVINMREGEEVSYFSRHERENEAQAALKDFATYVEFMSTNVGPEEVENEATILQVYNKVGPDTDVTRRLVYNGREKDPHKVNAMIKVMLVVVGGTSYSVMNARRQEFDKPMIKCGFVLEESVRFVCVFRIPEKEPRFKGGFQDFFISDGRYKLCSQMFIEIGDKMVEVDNIDKAAEVLRGEIVA